ncbi:hypothetical protein JNO54_10540 [Janibacter sp. YIM B02568]|uniref:hypothetical protein n=1 Tax=Janibacter endophyticus TaxID=2806261 RepID=UPI00194FBD77|nr:hypothetical protein [Janibacter endophyticus]MBM6546577.1 hypothetical protein [Janibacter endophyticus]
MTDPAPTPSPGPAVLAPSPADLASPQTGDLVVEAALRELDQVDPADLDAVLAVSEGVLQTLQERLRDIGD